jgi:DNA polymerase III gamma/tau subunit
MVARLCAQKKQKNLADAERSELLDLPDQEVVALTSQAAKVPIETLLDYLELVSAGEDEVARAANPRFLLETLLMRLTMLTKTLPISQLIERLTVLEKRLVSEAQGTPVGMKTGVPRISTMVVSNPNEATAVPAASLTIPEDKEQVWRAFISFVGKEKKFGSALAVAPESLTIGIAEKHHLNYLQDLENMTLLRSFAKRFFSREVTIQLTQLDVAPAKSQQEPLASGETGSEMVKEALRIFGGSIKGVRGDNS